MKTNSSINNTTYKVSVIVAVYNTERTVERCILSILEQTFDDFEIILVDDGSKDNSYAICREYALRHNNVSVIHKENGGLGSARNAGIKVAHGKYICFIDSDDYVTSDYIRLMYDIAEKFETDIVIAGYKLKHGKHIINYDPIDNVGIYIGKDYYNILLEYAHGNSYFYFAWNKLFRRNLIVEHSLHFIDRHCAEDMMFNAEYYKIAHSLAIVSGCEYIYTVENLNSLSNRRRDNFWEDMNLVFAAYQKIYENIQPEIQLQINNLLLVLLRNTLSNYISNERFDMQESVDFMRYCASDFVVSNRIREIIPHGLYNKITLYCIKHKNYRVYIQLIRMKAYVKWHMFSLFNTLRKFI